MAQPSNFLGINTGTEAKRAATTQPGGISNVLAWITDTARLWFFDGTTLGGIELALKSDLGAQMVSVYPAQAADFAAVAGKRYAVDTTAGPITATLPAAPTQGDQIAFKDTTGECATHPLTVALNGKSLEGSATNPVLNSAYAGIAIEFNGSQWVQMI